ncbi:MAG: hypothetical protein H0X42_12170, partial [Solirubrobacterales bacterium]|nr:hypothetical protein [Solirubrobacterales bacterium]
MPGDPSHDAERTISTLNGQAPPTPFEGSVHPFLTLPTSCHTSLTSTGEVESLQEPGVRHAESVGSLDGTPGPGHLTGCGSLAFEPTISAQPTTPNADSPTGLDVAIHQPQDEDPESTATAALQAAQVTLPEGMTLNPSAANGLAACSEAQIGRLPTPGVHFNKVPVSCPNAAKLGSVQVSTPLLDHEVTGAVYLAAPYQNPFGSLLAIYLALEDELSGTYVKLAGKVTPNPVTGQLTASFTENPQLPIEDIALHFFPGERAALKTPLACGTYTTQTLLTPWSAPEAPSATPSSSFATSVAAAGTGPCPASEAAAPNSPSFEAGTTTPLAGSYSPFVLRLTRPDGSQNLAGLTTTLPRGLVGKLAGVPYCPEGAIALAKSREAPNQGASELASPACPAASEVGSVTVG